MPVVARNQAISRSAKKEERSDIYFTSSLIWPSASA
jgi:hypothetical protein